MAITCFSYLGIILFLNKNSYSFLTYISFILVLLTEILAIIGLHVVIEGQKLEYYSLPILLFSLIHLILIAYVYIFTATSVSLYLAGNLIIFLAMTIVGSAMLGDIGFLTMIKKIIARIRN